MTILLCLKARLVFLDSIINEMGNINSNPQRIDDFIHAFEVKLKEAPEVCFELSELIFASVNDVLVEELLTERHTSLFNSFIRNHSKSPEVLPILNYLKSLKNNPEFPIASFLEKGKLSE